MSGFWLAGGQLVTPCGIREGAVQVVSGRVTAIRARSSGGQRVDLRGAYLAPGFIDLHVWGEPAIVARRVVAGGTTGFLTTLGPGPPKRLLRDVARRAASTTPRGAECLGFHLEGPFVNPARGGALPARSMRPPSVAELRRLVVAAGGRLRLVTIAPELRRALPAIRWCRQQGIIASLGHSAAEAATAMEAVEAGAQAVTHVFNGMQPLHHRAPSLLDVALLDSRLTAMVIADGVHVSAEALRLLIRAKGAWRVALATDSIRHAGWHVAARRGAFYLRDGTLAGSDLTMIRAVRNAVKFAGVSVEEAVRMASEVPATLLGLARSRGTLAIGKRADLVAFDQQFRVGMTIVGGRLVYERRG